MSSLDSINEEITRRQNSSKVLEESIPELLATQEQFAKLDELYRKNEDSSRVRLNSIYKESKHFTGKVPKVYTFVETEKYPFFGGSTDDKCNPYFPITKVQDKTTDGISPYYVAPSSSPSSPWTHTGSFNRDVAYTGQLEPPIRATALSAIATFPDISGESSSVGYCSGGTGESASSCQSSGGTWNYNSGATATEKLRAAIIPWKNKIQNDILPDLYLDPDNTHQTFWQNILNKLNELLTYIQTDVNYPNHTNDFTPGSAPDTIRDYFVSNQSSINTSISNRINYLSKESAKEEQAFFGILKLRLHQANGSFAKAKTIKGQITMNKSLIKDNTDAIASLNLLKVKNS
jgi:hypothetical protein